MVFLLDGSRVKGYLNPATLDRAESLDMLTPEGSHRSIELSGVKCVYFVRELTEPWQPEKKIFLSRPKLDGLWVRMKFQDDDVMEGITVNNILDLFDHGIQLTPPDLHGNTLRIYIPRTALAEMRVLGVVGVARRAPASRGARAAVAEQSKLFTE